MRFLFGIMIVASLGALAGFLYKFWLPGESISSSLPPTRRVSPPPGQPEVAAHFLGASSCSQIACHGGPKDGDRGEWQLCLLHDTYEPRLSRIE